MKSSSTALAYEETAPPVSRAESVPRSDRAAYMIYAFAIAASVSVWLLAIRAPLGIDETGSYWQISAGFSAIWPRQFMGLAFPAYPYILWFFTRCIGHSEIALRIPSVLAMLGAAGLLYRAARELFERDVSLVAVLIFCINPIVAFEAVDVRPYAFAVLITNAAILVLLRLRTSRSLWLAAIFGFLAAFVVYFHHLFAAILPAFLLCLIVFKFRDGRNGWKQVGIALAVFCIAFLPLIPGLEYLFRTAHSHVYEAVPGLLDLFWTLAPGWLLAAFVFAALFSLAKAGGLWLPPRWPWNPLLCVSFGLIPILILFGVSAGTPIHMFAARHRLVAVPGISLGWALAISCLPWRSARPRFCAVLAVMTLAFAFGSPNLGNHVPTWKYALEVAEKNASVDNAPVVMCSPFVESDYARMPVADPTQSIIFAPITYYKLSVPVVPLPKDFSDETTRVGAEFLRNAAQLHKRFLVLAYTANPIVTNTSYPTVQWIEKNASDAYSFRSLGVFDGIAVLEFVPRNPFASLSH
jgi:Dolichyl-phosphate-mannose-protein mannosyltransferase